MSEIGSAWFRRKRAALFSGTSSRAPEPKPRPRRSGIIALEPRIMYDAAAAATIGGAAQTHHDGAPDHAAITAAEKQPAPAASNTGADSPASAAQPKSLAQSPNVQTPPPPAGPDDVRTTSSLDASATPAPAGGVSEIVFIDSHVPDYQILANGVKAGVVAVILDPDKDGLTEIADYLSAHPSSNLTTIDIVAHGEDSTMFLGNSVLSSGNAAQYAAQFAAIGKALQPGGDLMLYGCDVAQDPSGVALLDQIARATGVDVAASTGLVGSAARGGSWTLSATEGVVTSAAPFTAETLALYPDVLDALTVVAQDNAALDTAGVDADVVVASGAAGALFTGDSSVAPLAVSVVQGVADNDPIAVTVAGVTAHGSYGDLTVNADGGYSYTAKVAFDAIPSDSSPTDQFSITVTDGTGVVATTLKITITGANDNPVVTAKTDTATDTAAADAGKQVASGVPGKLLVGDSDAEGDTLTIASVKGSGDSSAVTMTAGSATAHGSYGDLTVNADGGYSYVANAAFDALRAGNNPTDQFDFTVSDGNGGNAQTTLKITITGGNDTPVITVSTNPADVTEAANASAQVVNTSGTLTVTDRDIGDSLTGSATGSGAALLDGGIVPAQYLSNITALLDATAIGVNTVTTDGGSKQLTWTYNPAAANLDFLAGGQKLTIDYMLQVDDGQGNTGSQMVRVTIVGTNDAPVASVAPATPFSVAEQTVLNLKTTGLSVSDVDGGSGIETATLSVSEGTLSLTAGTSNAMVTGNNSGSVTITGTIAQINALLNSDGTSTVTYIDSTDTPGASATLTLAISDAGNSGTDTAHSSSASSTITLVAVNDAPTAVVPAGPYSAVENIGLSLKGTGLSVGDVDGGSGIETATLSVGEGVLHVVTGDSGALVSNSDTSTVTIKGTIAQINALLGAGGTSVITYTDNKDNPSASTVLTLSINDGGNTGGTLATGLTASASATINITAVNDAPTAVNDGYTTSVNTTLTIPAAGFGVLSNDSDPEGSALSAVLVSNVQHGTLTLNSDGTFVYTPAAGFTGTDTFTYRASDGLLLSTATATVTLTVMAATSGTPPSDQIWISTAGLGNTASSNSSNVAAIVADTRIMSADVASGTTTTIFQDAGTVTTSTGTRAAPILQPSHIVVDVANNLYFVIAAASSGGSTGGQIFAGHLNSSAAPVLIYTNPDSDVAQGAGILDLAIDPVSHTLYISQNANYESTGLKANNGIFGYTYNTSTGALAGTPSLSLTYDPKYTDTVTGTQIGYMASQPVNGFLYFEAVTYTTWTGTFQYYSLNLATQAVTALTPVNWLPTYDYHTYTGTFAGDLEVDTLTGNIYLFTTPTVNGSATGEKFYEFTPGSSTLPALVTLSGGTNPGTLSSMAFDPTTNQFIFTNYSTQKIEFYNVSSDGRTLTYASAIGLGLHPGGDPSGDFGTASSPFDAPTGVFFTKADLPPTDAILNTSYIATEQTALLLKNTGLSVADPDGGNSIETVKLTVGEGVLNVTAGGSGANVSGSGTATVTITGTLAQINALLSTDASSTVSYIDNLDAPATHTTLTLSITDSGNLTAIDTATIFITAVNDAPTATIPGGPFSATEQTALDLKPKGLAVADVDGGSFVETVTLSVGQGILNVTGGSSGASVSGSGTSSVTITGTLQQINRLLSTDATSIVSYINPSDTPAASTTLTLAINDGGHSGTGGAKTGSASATINITAVNDAPVAADDVYTSLQGGTVTGASVLGNDTDVDTSHALLTAAVVTGPSHGVLNFLPDGTFSYTPNAGFSGTDYFTYNASDGSLTSNLAKVTINVTSSPLTAGDDFYATSEDTPLIVDAANGVLFNDADTALPITGVTVVGNPAHGTVTLQNDGSFVYTPASNFAGTDSFTYQISDAGGNAPSIATVTITVSPVNDAPVLTPSAPADVSYVENAAATPLFAGEAVTDVDNPANFAGGSMTVAISAGYTAGDQIVLLGSSGFSVAAGVLFDGVNNIGTVTQSASSFVVQLSPLATPAEVNKLAAAFGFLNTTDNPGSADRTITLTFNDGGNTGSGPSGGLSASATQTVHVTPVDDPPAVNAGNSINYTEKAAPVVIDSGLTVTDVDSTALTRAVISITNYVAGDTLTAPSGAGIDVISNVNGVLVLTLTGSSSPADYQAVLQQITFANASNADPTVGGTNLTRTVSWVVTDDTGLDSPVATTTIAITAVNDAPSEIVPASLHSLPGLPITISAVVFSDPDDSGGIEQATFSAASTGAASNGAFTAVNGAGVTVSGSNTDHVTLSGTVADLNAFIAGGMLTFLQPSPSSPGTPVVTDIAVVIDDQGHTGGAAQHSATSHIAITGNSPPSAPVDQDAVANSVEEGAATGTLVHLTAQSTDADNDAITYSIVGRGAVAFQIDPATGVVSVRDGSRIDYESNPTHTTTITVQADDGKGGVTTSDFVIEITDRPPDSPATNLAGTTPSVVEGAANGTAVGLQVSTTDVNGGTVSYSLAPDSAGLGFAIDPVSGIVTVSDSSKIDFESSGGHYTLNVRASDPSGNFSTTAFVVDVQDVAPVATGEAYTTDEDTPLVVTAAHGLLINDSDINGGALTAVLETGPAHGALQLNADGSFRYLSSQDYNGTDSFTYRVSDGTMTSNLVTVSLTINPVNDPPVVSGGNVLDFNANLGKPAVINPAIAVHDVDSTTLASAQVAIAGGFEAANDKLGFVNGNGITGSYNAATGVLTLTGVASVADYQAALASVTFFSTTQRSGPRTIQWSSNDGSAQFSESLPASTTVNVSGILVPPHMFSTTPPVPVVTPVFVATDGGPTGPQPGGGEDDFSGGYGGFGYHLVTGGAMLTTASDSSIQINLALAALAAPLGGDVAYVTAHLANGAPLPDWLSFDPATGLFAGLPPDGMVASIDPDASPAERDMTGALPPNPDLGSVPDKSTPPQTMTIEVKAWDSKGNMAVTIFTIDLRPRSGKQGWNMDRSLQPFGAERHARLATESSELAAIEAAVRDATRPFEPYVQRGFAIRSGGDVVSRAAAVPPGRAGLTEQLAQIGWRSMDAQRNALLASLQPRR